MYFILFEGSYWVRNNASHLWDILCCFCFALLLLFSDLKHSREPDSVPAHRVSSNVPQPPPSRPSHDAIRALKPPLPINAETVSKQVLSKQARYQPIRADDLIAKAGTLTWVKKLLQVRLCKSPIPSLSDPSMSFSLFRLFSTFQTCGGEQVGDMSSCLCDEFKCFYFS